MILETVSQRLFLKKIMPPLIQSGRTMILHPVNIPSATKMDHRDGRRVASMTTRKPTYR